MAHDDCMAPCLTSAAGARLHTPYLLFTRHDCFGTLEASFGVSKGEDEGLEPTHSNSP